MKRRFLTPRVFEGSNLWEKAIKGYLLYAALFLYLKKSALLCFFKRRADQTRANSADSCTQYLKYTKINASIKNICSKTRMLQVIGYLF
jgi:hypothetical protein